MICYDALLSFLRKIYDILGENVNAILYESVFMVGKDFEEAVSRLAREAEVDELTVFRKLTEFMSLLKLRSFNLTEDSAKVVLGDALRVMYGVDGTSGEAPAASCSGLLRRLPGGADGQGDHLGEVPQP